MTRLTCLILYLSCVIHFTKGTNSTLPVRWTLYSDLWLTWNEAAKFCREQGGHLPVTDTYLAFNAFTHWVGAWPEAVVKKNAKDVKEKDMWTGLYKVNAGFNDTVYRWERGGSEFTLEDIPRSFWDVTFKEPNRLDEQPCVRIDKIRLKIKTIWCNPYEVYGRNRVVCEFYEECCTYNHRPVAPKANTVLTSYPEVTSLEGCWELCENIQSPGDECLEARWNRDTAVCPDTTPHSVSMSVDGMETANRQLQHCFVGEESITPSTYRYVNIQNEAVDIGPPTVAPQNFVCTLVTDTLSATTLPVTTLADATLPDATLTETTLTDTTLTDTTLTDSTLTDSTLTDTTLTNSTLTDTTLTDSTLTDTTLTDSTLTDTTLTDSTLTDTTLTDSTLTDTTLTDSTLSDITLTDTTLTDSTLTDSTLTDTTLTDTTLSDTTLTEAKLPDTALTATTLFDTTLTATTLSDTTLTETTVSDTALTETKLLDTTLTETTLQDNTLTDATLPDTALSETTLPDTTTGILSGNGFKSEALTHSEAMTTGVEPESSTAGDIPFETATTSTTEEISSMGALLNSSDAQCYCRCPYQAAANTSSSPTAHLHVVEKSSTSSFRRRHSSQWTSPSVTTIAISTTMISSVTAFLAFFACCDLATLARYCSARKTAAVKPEEA